MNGALRRPLSLLLARAFSILVAGAALVSGIPAMSRDVTVLSGPPRESLSPTFRIQLKTVTQRLPPGEILLHFSVPPEIWYSRLWQRVLYPRNTTIVVQPPVSPDHVQQLRSKYGARFAISAGDPPFDPGYLWKVELGPLPGVSGVSFFGELTPLPPPVPNP